MSGKGWLVYEIERGVGGNVPKADGKVYHHECADRAGLIDADGFAARGLVSGPYSWGAARCCDGCGADVSEQPRAYSDDYRPCQCGSEVFAKYDVLGTPSLPDARISWVERTEILCAWCQRKAIAKVPQ